MRCILQRPHQVVVDAKDRFGEVVGGSRLSEFRLQILVGGRVLSSAAVLFRVLPKLGETMLCRGLLQLALR